MKNVLVTGGAGYIGSFMVRKLLKEGNIVIVLDNLEGTNEKNLEKIKKENPSSELRFEKADLRYKWQINKVFEKYYIDTVVHLAGYSNVVESMRNPLKYFNNNVGGTINLLETMSQFGVRKIVFSSTAAVYSDSAKSPIKEQDKINPVNYYGLSKLMCEKIILAAKAENINSVIFRYFNAAGASNDGVLGQDDIATSSLIPSVIAYSLKKRHSFFLYGNDYSTPDGSCIRDYVHIEDIVNAHMLGIEKLETMKGAVVYNLGSQTGYSNLEIINKVKALSDNDFTYQVRKKRVGDSAVLIADSSKIEKELGWSRTFSIDDILKTEYEYIKTRIEI